MRKIKYLNLILPLTLTILCYTIPTRVHSFSPIDNKLYQGIDISGYQGDIDFAKVKQAGIDVVYIKSSEGFNYIDSKFEQNYKRAKENGLLVGFYHYVTARTQEQAKKQAHFFAQVISSKSPDCKLAMDFESFGSLSKEQINEIGLIFMQEVERLTKKQTILYSNAYTASNIWQGEVTNYPLWIAQYEVSEPENSGTWEKWVGWQYTDEGKVNGIEGYVDKNYFTKEVFLANNSEIPPIEPPKEEEESTKTTTIIIQKGDTLSQLAIKYHTTVKELVTLNHIQNPNLIYAGDTLIIPISQKEESETINYIVKKGDTLWQIAKNFETTIQEIATQNQIKNVNLIYPGQILKIITNCKHDCGHTLYTVKKGDTLWSISRRYGTSIANIVRKNRIQNPNLIYPGQIFRI